LKSYKNRLNILFYFQHKNTLLKKVNSLISSLDIEINRLES